MQKHAFPRSLGHYPTLFEPLPTQADTILYCDEHAIPLPYAEDFPKLHYHDRYEIGICESGDGLFLSEGCFSSVSTGDLIFIVPGAHHYSRSLHHDAPCYCRFVYVQAKAIESILFLQANRSAEEITHRAHSLPTLIRPSENPKDASLLKEITDLAQKSFPHREALIALRLAIFLLENDRHSPTSDLLIPPPKSSDVCDRIAEYLALHYHEAITTHTLAELCHLSESQLCRRFLAAYGMPPIAYRNSLRAQIASELLRRTDFSIAEISEQVGYTTPSDFTRAFRKAYGIAPSDYRKENGRGKIHSPNNKI